MKNYAKKFFAILLAVVFSVGIFLAVTALSRVSSSVSDTRVKIGFEQFYKQKRNSLNVVLIGSSAVYREYMAIENWAEYGFTSYYLATMGQSFNTTKYLIKEADKTQNPQLYVIEIRRLIKDIVTEWNGNQQSENTGASVNRFLANCMTFSYNRYQMIKETMPDDIFYSYFDFIRNHSNWSDIPMSIFFDNLFTEITYSDYISTKCANAITTCKPLDAVERSNSAACTLPENAKAVLDDLLSYIRENNINVLFLSTPYHQSTEYGTAENSVKEYLYSEGFTYLNCNEYYAEIDIDFLSDFYDEKHTNILGALKVTGFIGEYINDHYFLDRNYSQKVTDDWDKALEAWEKERKILCVEAENNVREAKNGINT